jgi:hypothetical protein
MNAAPRILSIIIATMIICMYSLKLRRNFESVSKDALVKFLVGGFLFPLHPLMRVSDNTSVVFQIVATLSQYYSILFIHLGVTQLKRGKVYFNIFKEKIICFVNLMSILMISLILVEKENLVSFSDGEKYVPTHTYYIFYIINYLIIFTVCLSILFTFNKENYTHQEVKKAIWWYLGPFCIVFMTVGSGVMIVNVLLSYVWGDYYKDILNDVYSSSKLLFVISLGLFTIIPLLPNLLLEKLFNPIRVILDNRSKKQNELIKYLHKHMVTIVPNVRLNDKFNERADHLAEIADARLLISTNKPKDWYRSPKSEASLILEMINNKEVLNDFGDFNPIEKGLDEIKHNVKVAEYLISRRGSL